MGSCERGALFCLEPETGAEIWMQQEHANCYSSPIPAAIDGVEQLVQLNHDGLCGVEVETGRVLWEYAFPHEGRAQNTPTPVVHEGVVVVGAEDRGMFAVRAVQEGSSWKVETLWDHREVSLDMSSPVVSGSVVVGFSHFNRGQFFGLDPVSGNVLWQGDPRSGENAALLAVSGHVLALTDRGELHVVRSSRKRWDLLRTYRVGGQGTWTAPALLRDSILIKNGDTLTRWRIPQG